MATETDRHSYARTELVWAGKRSRVDHVALPFQRVETVNAPRGADLFSAAAEAGGWRNKLIWGDNKLVMASLLKGDAAAGIESLAGKIDLIYIDPPFDTGADFSFRARVGEEEVQKEPSILEHLAYRDTWGRGTDSYLQMLYDRLALVRELLAPYGSLYVHLDDNISSYARVVLDDIFGAGSFVNAITWKRSHAHSDERQGARHYGRVTDVILFYAKSETPIWHPQYTPYDPEYVDRDYRRVDSDGRRYRIDNLQGPGGAAKGNPFYEVMGVSRHWRYSRERMDELVRQGRVIQTKPGAVPQYKRYLDEMPGVPAQNLWDDIPVINNRSKEALDYETQKPEALLERVISTSSDEDSLVADFFAGSGTTAAVAQKLGRRWIGCDLGRFAIHTSRKRLLELGATFDVLNLGKYERSLWQGATLGAQLRAYVDFILALYRAEGAPGFRHLHGKKAGRAVHVGAVDSPVTFDEVDELLAECRQTHTQAVDVLGWEWEMNLNEQAKQRAEAAGVELRLYRIPNDVMDKRAKAEDVHFYSLAYVEARAKPVQARTVQVELTDFIIPDMDLIPSEVRAKVSRWSDYIDYWAVDFDYRDDTFCNGWQAYRTRNRKTLDTVSATHTYGGTGTYTVLVKVVDVFGIDSTKRLEVTV